MNTIDFYQIDAFADCTFKGNPAGVCPLIEWLPVEIMQSIALENNLSETAFYVKKNNTYEIRWFTPTTEVDLCGHATLASAFVELNLKNKSQNEIIFNSKSGKLKVSKNDDYLTLNFPTDSIKEIELTKQLCTPFTKKPIKAFRGASDILIQFESENDIKKMTPDLNLISKINCRGVIVTAQGRNCDFVSRFFAPKFGIDEDPVTGSAHTSLIPFWSNKLNKTTLTARQLSKRGGELKCTLNNERVTISGKACLYLEGKIYY